MSGAVNVFDLHIEKLTDMLRDFFKRHFTIVDHIG